MLSRDHDQGVRILFHSISHSFLKGAFRALDATDFPREPLILFSMTGSVDSFIVLSPLAHLSCRPQTLAAVAMGSAALADLTLTFAIFSILRKDGAKLKKYVAASPFHSYVCLTCAVLLTGRKILLRPLSCMWSIPVRLVHELPTSAMLMLLPRAYGSVRVPPLLVFYNGLMLGSLSDMLSLSLVSNVSLIFLP